jgi:hypothetical protein
LGVRNFHLCSLKHRASPDVDHLPFGQMRRQYLG